jgi:hypothetical protein
MTTDKDEEVLAALEGYDEEPEPQDDPEVEEPEPQPDPQPDPEPQATDWEAEARARGWAPQQQEQPQQPQPQDFTNDYQEIADLMYSDPAAALQKQAELTRKQMLQDLAPVLAPVVQQTAVQTVQRLTNAEPDLLPYIEQVTREAGVTANISKEQAEFIADAARGRALRTGAIKPQPQATKRVVNTTNASPVQATVTQSIPVQLRQDVAQYEAAFGVKVDANYLKQRGIEL